jgi:Phage capsid protein
MKKIFSFIAILFAFIGLPFSGVAYYNAPGAELLQRLFLTEIQPLLFPSNAFFNRSKIDDAFVNNNSVELPHSGTIPSVGVNRAALPAPVAQRTDLATNYVLQELTTDPTLIQDSEAFIVAYAKRESVLSLHAMAINDKAAIRALYAWSTGLTQVNTPGPTTGYFVTTGTTRNSSAPSSTKTSIHGLGYADIVNAKLVLDSQNIPQDNRVLIVNAQQYADLLSLQQFTYLQNFGNVVLPSGVIQRVLGLDIYMRAVTPTYTWSSGTVQTLRSEGYTATPSTDVGSALLYHQDFVRRGKGATKVYVTPDQANYYGTLFSMMVRFGAAQTRNDFKGIIAIVEG